MWDVAVRIRAIGGHGKPSTAKALDRLPVRQAVHHRPTAGHGVVSQTAGHRILTRRTVQARRYGRSPAVPTDVSSVANRGIRTVRTWWYGVLSELRDLVVTVTHLSTLFL